MTFTYPEVSKTLTLTVVLVALAIAPASAQTQLRDVKSARSLVHAELHLWQTEQADLGAGETELNAFVDAGIRRLSGRAQGRAECADRD